MHTSTSYEKLESKPKYNAGRLIRLYTLLLLVVVVLSYVASVFFRCSRPAKSGQATSSLIPLYLCKRVYTRIYYIHMCTRVINK